jgi:hypothetical protein
MASKNLQKAPESAATGTKKAAGVSPSTTFSKPISAGKK